jgi:glycosyltransferase involved in cell wall biosynthesis
MTEKARILALFGSAALYGAERANIEALSALKERGCQILCLVRNEKWSTLVPAALESRGLACRKIPYIEQPLPGRLLFVLFRNPIAFLIANWKFLWIIRQFKPTHIHAYGQFFVLNFQLALMLVRVPMIFRAGDEPILHSWLWRTNWRFVIRRTARFVANAAFVARSLQATGVPAEKITIIYNKPPARPSLKPVALNVEVPCGTRPFAYVGQISEHKGPHILIAAFRQLVSSFPDARLFLAGRISDWEGDAWARALRDATKKDPLIGERITFLGEIEDVPGLLARCEALVVPSLFDDPSPNVVMEAKQAGRAVIAFPRGGLPELIEHGVDGLLCRETTRTALIEALRTYLINPGMARAHGAAALASSARFGNERLGANWSKIYALASRVKQQGALTASP